MKYIKDGKIVLPNRIEKTAVLVFDKKIKGLINESEIPEGAEVISADGNYVCPGFVDIHIHGYAGADTSDGSADGIKAIAEEIIKNGVTSFLPTTMTVSEEEINAAFASVRKVKESSKSWNGAEILGVHAEGPFINSAKKGAQSEKNIKKPNINFVLDNADIIKLITIAPEVDDRHKFIKEISRNTGIAVSMGHTNATYDEAASAIADGISHATHLFNAMPPFSHREPGAVGAALSSDIYVELICDTFHIHPSLFGIVASVKGDKLCLITDCTKAGGMPDGEYSLGGQKTFLRGVECRLADGTIAGSVLRMNEAIKNLLKYTSLEVFEAVAAASLNPARSIGIKNKGALEAGYDADIVIADRDFNIREVIKAGKSVYTK